ncbi:hypothetical protein [Inquilinus sp. OTU3971]|uniref:hypothetical protein n=1 Tax=Inquilinus sp. OTU3971 TaxID=3043855 RepID=UPI00313EECC3
MTINSFTFGEVVVLNGHVVTDITSAEVNWKIMQEIGVQLEAFYNKIKDRLPVKLSDLTLHRDLEEVLNFDIRWKSIPLALQDADIDVAHLAHEVYSEDDEAVVVAD